MTSVFRAIRQSGYNMAAFGFADQLNPHTFGTVAYSCWLAGWESYHFGR